MLILPEFLISGLKLFQPRVVEGKKNFLVISNRQNLSPEIRNSGNINIFKRKIKILLEKVPFYFGWGDRKLNIIHSNWSE
jgi:hypothetical protein